MKDVGKYFDDLIEEHGYSIEGLDYGSKEMQDLRFQMMVDEVDFRGKSVLDIGCGFADLEYFLRQRKGIDHGVYSGIEASKRVVDYVREIRPYLTIYYDEWPIVDPEIRAGLYDVVVMNGILLYHDSDRMIEMIREAWKVTRKVLIFDCQSTGASKRHKKEYYRAPGPMMTYCFQQTPYVCLRHEMAEHFFMIFMYREKRRG